MEKEIQEFSQYLTTIGHSWHTKKTYTHVLRIFLKENPNAYKFTFGDIIYYLKQKSERAPTIHRNPRFISGIKKYYDYLVETRRRKNHPCRNFHIRTNFKKTIVHTDLFNSEELELLLSRCERYEMLHQRNQVLISLLIYQALSPGEISRLNISDLDMGEGKIFIKGSAQRSQRWLDITIKQYHIFKSYLYCDRSKLIPKDSEAFVIGKLGNRIKVDDIHHLISSYKISFPDRKLTTVTIRQSVIANWLNEKKIPLEQVQIISGQKWMSTTKRYKSEDLHEKRRLINIYHPLQ